MHAAGVVLAGGRSSRMGTAKAALEWHGSTMLYRTVALLGRTVDGPLVVVASPGQVLPPLPAGAEVVADPVEGRGPLVGIGAGLAAVAGRAPVAFVCSTDMPFLHPAFVRRVLSAVRPGVDVALPHARGFRQPLAAAYRPDLAALVRAILEEHPPGKLGPGLLFARCAVARLDDAALLADADVARLDPDLDSVLNVNTPDEYTAARARQAAVVRVEGIGPVRAATLGELHPTGPVTLNGGPVGTDPYLPMVAGDTVRFG
ncbi:molybdenum cofactor guanylyltransferase [Pseudonocardia sp.]|uniref:molybdenum cofactor guanylyltransferase n=1 Tax=Pseudonocardia sp. TaxID=60912 RepID=UPI0026272019|nr:molybdenum cofactor guanylyltransferase [Pseudonocardia sp.]